MMKIKKFNSKDDRMLKIRFLVIIVLFSITVLISIFLYNNKLREVVKEEGKITLKNVSSQNKINLNNIIEEKQNLLKALAKIIEDNNNYEFEYNIDKLNLYVDLNKFYSIGIINKNGIGYTTLGQKLDLYNYDYFQNAMKGIGRVYSSYISQDKKEKLNIFAEPIYLNNEVEMVITATYKSNDFFNMININSFDNNGKSMVIDSNGKLITEPYDDEYSLKKEIIDIHKENISKIVYYNAKDHKENFIEFEYLGKEYLAYYEFTGINDWYLISYVPKNHVYKNIYIINKMIFIGNMIIYLVIILFIIILFNAYIKYQKKIASIIFIDELTKEKNNEYLKLEFENMNSKDKVGKSLIVMDINNFKIINIMYGIKIGDKILKYIPTVFKEVLPNDNIFKGDADLFIIIVNSTSKEEIINKIKKLEDRIRKDFENKVIVPIEFSFGVCSFDKFEDLHSIYNNALISKNEIKGNVNNNIGFFTEECKNKIIENRKIEDSFKSSIKNNEFEVWYQPKYNMKTNKVCGAEALVRWRKEDGSLIPPAKFIPVFENTGQIVELDELVIETVFKNIGEMKALGLKINPISINLSRVNIYNLDVVDKIKKLSQTYKIKSSDVSFEITESALIENNKSINKLIRKLHKLGFNVDMDDYGVGTSTLNSLFASDFDTLKLDKSFIDYIGNDKMDTIIESTIRMARELNMKIIAEGVESKEQVDFLINNNCNIAQGYYFSKPLSKEDYFKLIQIMI